MSGCSVWGRYLSFPILHVAINYVSAHFLKHPRSVEAGSYQETAVIERRWVGRVVVQHAAQVPRTTKSKILSFLLTPARL